MMLEHRKIHASELQEVGENCIWLLKEGGEEFPLFVQLDWNLSGALSRAHKRNLLSKERSLLPFLKKVPSQYVMLEYEFDSEIFIKTCSGMKFDKVAIVCASETRASEIALELKSQNSAEFPKSIVLVVEEKKRG